MTRKTLGFMNVSDGELLSRDEMKGIMAGSTSTCLICGGSDDTVVSWHVAEEVWGTEPPTGVCNDIFPGSGLTGTWSYC